MNTLDKIPTSDMVMASLVMVGLEIESLNPIKQTPKENLLWDDENMVVWDNGMEVLTNK